MVEIWLPHLPRNEQFYPRASLVAIEDLVIDDLYVELVVTFDLKCHTCNNLAVENVISVAHLYKNGDGLLFKESSNFHRLRVRVSGQHKHCIVILLGLFLYGFIFEFEVLFRWYGVLILYWFDDEKPPLLATMFSAQCLDESRLWLDERIGLDGSRLWLDEWNLAVSYLDFKPIVIIFLEH
ncbi:hypothetical protein B296_00001233 [Ensete ventricosum]|uniref:Uncharacterized protein n=1 Tax=Ensete ventricosum TaxID=4639 RepID=A0A427ABR6_ENSVE|nr:hypothetical protein B296_00001233 [Ensete ventricosum]